MAGEGDAKARFPRQDVNDGQKHSYLGDVDVYDEPGAGASNVTGADRATGKRGKSETGGTIGHSTDADVQTNG